MTVQMTSQWLDLSLRDIFTRYHATDARYRHLAFSSKDFAVLPELATAITHCLPDYKVWDGNQPTAHAPPGTGSRFDFIQQTFSQPTGLIIVQPDYWFRHWSGLDEQAFWSALSTREGCHPVVVVFAQNHGFSQQNNHYFLPQELHGTAITLWVSSKVPLSS